MKNHDASTIETRQVKRLHASAIKLIGMVSRCVGVVAIVLSVAACGSGDSSNQAGEARDRDARQRTAERPQRWEPTIVEGNRIELHGVVMRKPAHWRESQPVNAVQRTMLIVPGKAGASQAHVDIFTFEPKGGGSMEENIQRWRGQFREGQDSDSPMPEPRVHELDIDGMSVTVVELSGSYARAGAPYLVDDQRLIGGLIDGPRGLIVLRLTGPDNTVAGARDAFLTMIGSVEQSAE